MPYRCCRTSSLWSLLFSVAALVTFDGDLEAQLAGPIDTLRLARTTAGTARVGYVTSLAVAGNQILLGDMQLNPHLARFDRRNFRLIGRDGPDGTGMGQLHEPTCITPNLDDDDHVWVFDRTRSVLTSLRIDGRSEDIVREIPLPGLPRATLCAAWSNGRIVLHSYFPDFLATTDSVGGARKSLGVPPPYDHDNLNTSVFARSPSGARMALAYNYSTRLDLFDATGKRYASLRGPHATNEVRYAMDDRSGLGNRALVSNQSETAYFALAATEHFLYAVYAGCAGGHCLWGGRHLQIFRWDGTLVRELAVDRWVKMIAVTPDDAVLYGVYAEARNGFDQKLGEWPLPPLRR
jgi:hypothetical protein